MDAFVRPAVWLCLPGIIPQFFHFRVQGLPVRPPKQYVRIRADVSGAYFSFSQVLRKKERSITVQPGDVFAASVSEKEGILSSVRGLFHRDYEEKQAVSQMDLSVRGGEFVGLIGPNGAGKTTLVKMLTGIIAPTSGEISVLGYYPNKLENDFKRQYAVVMGQKSQLFFELTAEDTLHLFRQIYGLSDKEYRYNRDYFVELFGVKELMDVQVRTLSLGERMKMELIVALLHNPKILFLDEPTIGLDAVAGRQVRKFLKEVNEEKGTTILLTSHYMEDIKSLCSRCVVVNHGSKIYDGATEELFDRYQKNKRITLTFERPEKIAPNSEWRILEDTAYKKIIEVPREKAGGSLRLLLEHNPVDVTIEEEEIGKIVERIYREGGKWDA